MKVKFRYILFASAAILAAVACNKETRPDDGATLTPILLNATEAGTNRHLNNGTFSETKAMLDAGDGETQGTFYTDGNRLQIYDFVDNATEAYIDDQVGPDVPGNNYGYPGVWPFVGGPHQWTPGVHKFFGWLAYDANAGMEDTADTPEEFFGTGFTFAEATRTLTIPSKTITIATPQFDFLYSNIISTEARQEPVGLVFSHLFTAFRITALNRDDASTITIKKIVLSGIHNTKSAQIVFSGTEPAVTYNDSGTHADFTFNISAADGVLTTDAKDMTATYLLWPQTSADFTHATMSIEYDYTIDGQTSQNSRPGIPLGSTFEWKAGVVNSLNIAFDVDQITFYINSLQEWDYANEQDIVVGL